MTIDEATEVLIFAHSHWPRGSRFRFFSRKNGKVFGCSIIGPVDLSTLTDWSDKHGWSSYWQINPTVRSSGTRCSTRDISHWTFLPLDIDPVASSYYGLGCLYEIEDHLQALIGDSFIPENRTLIDSGRGLQALYSMPSRELDDADRVAIPQAMSRLMSHVAQAVGNCMGCVLDTSCSDLPRVMRLPYTINPKTGLKAEFIQKSTDHALPDSSVITSLYPPKPKAPITQMNGDHWIDYLPHITVAGRKFLEGGTSPGSRHKAATATMLSMMDCGAPPGPILAALRMGALLCTPSLPYHEVEDMVFRRFRLTITQRTDILPSS